MDKLLEMYNLPILNQEEIENMNRPITSNETESVITNKSPEPAGFAGEFYQKFKSELTLILLKPFQKTEEEGMLPNSFYKTSITLIPKTDKDSTQKRKSQANITDEHR